MPTKLSAATAANAIRKRITNQPEVPLLVHWQLNEVPVLMAQALMPSHSVIWVMATAERLQRVQAALLSAGITPHCLRAAPATIDVPDNAKPIVRLRAKKKAEAAAKFITPRAGSITLLLIQSLQHRQQFEAAMAAEKALFVFDHIGWLNARWLDRRDEEGSGRMVNIEDQDRFFPEVQKKSISTVFLARDEYELALLRADMKRRSLPIAELETKYRPHPKLAISVVGTNLVTKKYATGAFLAVAIANREVQVIGESLIGAATPAKASMSTVASSSKVVLRISHEHPDQTRVAMKQTGLSEEQHRQMRLRDFVRTAAMSISVTSRKPEIVILCPENMLAYVKKIVGVRGETIPRWNYRLRAQPVAGSTPFAQGVIANATSYPTTLLNARHRDRFREVFAELDEQALTSRLSRLGLALHNSTGLAEEFDLSGRQEVNAASEASDSAVATFNRALDVTLEWSPDEPGKNPENRVARLAVFRAYREQLEAQERTH